MHLELITYNRKANTDKADFMAAMEQIDRFCEKQHGFVYRALSYDADGDLWYDSVYWQDEQALENAGKSYQNSGLMEVLAPLIVADSVTMKKSKVEMTLDASQLANAS